VKYISFKTFLLIVFSAMIASACSNRKNTFATRSYHNLTAHYNVLFNGNESFKKGMIYIDENFKDDYSLILPVFTYDNKEIATAISSDMDAAITKSTKCIKLHSIKAKPKMPEGGRISIDDKEYYNKNEYNKWIDNAYMLIGKSHFYKQDYTNAGATFSFVQHEFNKEPAMYESLIWAARLDCVNGEYKDAGVIIAKLEADKRFPKKELQLDLLTTKADLFIRQNKYYDAAKILETALELEHRKRTKIRYMFILAQLYQESKQETKAVEMYKRIIKKNPPYEVTFNARINLASVVAAGEGTDYIRTQLNKMLRDDKNIDYHDQIYYALGNLEMKEGNSPKAIEYYKMSVQSSTKNKAQKALSCLTLGNYYYLKKSYVSSQAYYDTALVNLDEKYPGIENIRLKANNLNRLVKNLNTISTEDSLQKVALMTEAERSRLVEQIISDLKQKEEADKIAEQQRLQEYYSNQSRQSQLGGNKEQAKWYFYNQVSLSQGIKDFQLKWGKRTLEDNWRRKNKGITEMSSDFGEAEEGEKKQDKKKVLDNKSPEYYLQNLPMTDSAKKASTDRIINAYYEGGTVYRNDLQDLPQAVALYEKMMTRFPDNQYNTTVYYQLYSMNVEMKNEGRAAYYKNLILTKFPESTAAKILTDTSYYKQVIEHEKIVDQFYQATYQLYNEGQYNQVLSNVQSAFDRFKNDPVLPKFALLKALATGKTSDPVTFRAELNQLVVNYPKHEVSAYAKQILTFMNEYKPETKVVEDIQEAKVIFTSDSTAKQWYLAISLERKEDINQVVFDILNFNLDNFSNDKLEMSNEDMGKTLKVVSVRTFTDRNKALQYYRIFMSKPETIKSIKGNKQIFLVTPDNYKILLKQESADSYIQFFKLEYKL
jgi:tetratricopeptide (TPR) repeat protein